MGVIKSCKGIHELCSIKIQRGFGCFDILYRRIEGTPYRVLCVAAVEASRIFFSRKELCRGWGVCCHNFSFVLFFTV